MKTQKELRLATLVDERATVDRMHETLLSAVGHADDKMPSESQAEQLTAYREKAELLDGEIDTLADDVKRDQKAAETSRTVRRMLAGSADGVDVDDDGIVYRNFYSYARDVVVTRESQGFAAIAATIGGADEIQAARDRLSLVKRTPDNTLSSDVPGLQPAQHIAQIFQVINKGRPLVATALRSTLERGQLTYPKVTAKPVVAVQASEKTEAGNTGMQVDMETAQASTYLGGGDLSWQVLNWSSPDALQLWFDLAAADYALKTETDAAQTMTDDAYTNRISSTLSGSWTFANFMTAIGAGYSKVFTESSRVANTVWMAPDVYGYLLGLTSSVFTQFVNVSGDAAGPLDFVVSRGLGAGEIVVGDRAGLLVAETSGAPVELRAVEPAIGGLEVGIIGAFEAVVVDPGAFSLVTAAS